MFAITQVYRTKAGAKVRAGILEIELKEAQ